MSETTQVARAILLIDEMADYLRDDKSDAARDLVARAVAMARMLRNYTEDIEALIRNCAAKGMGKQETQEVLGISRYRFQLLMSVMKDVQWVPSNQTSGRRRHYESVKGVPRGTEATRAAVAAFVESKRQYTICGIRGTVTELYKLWHDYCSVGYSTINRRLAQGDSVYDAFFGDRMPSAVEIKASNRDTKAFRGVVR